MWALESACYRTVCRPREASPGACKRFRASSVAIGPGGSCCHLMRACEGICPPCGQTNLPACLSRREAVSSGSVRRTRCGVANLSTAAAVPFAGSWGEAPGCFSWFVLLQKQENERVYNANQALTKNQRKPTGRTTNETLMFVPLGLRGPLLFRSAGKGGKRGRLKGSASAPD